MFVAGYRGDDTGGTAVGCSNIVWQKDLTLVLPHFPLALLASFDHLCCPNLTTSIEILVEINPDLLSRFCWKSTLVYL